MLADAEPPRPPRLLSQPSLSSPISFQPQEPRPEEEALSEDISIASHHSFAQFTATRDRRPLRRLGRLLKFTCCAAPPPSPSPTPRRRQEESRGLATRVCPPAVGREQQASVRDEETQVTPTPEEKEEEQEAAMTTALESLPELSEDAESSAIDETRLAEVSALPDSQLRSRLENLGVRKDSLVIPSVFAGLVNPRN